MIKLIENSENSGYLEAKFFPLESLRFLGTFSVFFFCEMLGAKSKFYESLTINSDLRTQVHVLSISKDVQ